MLVKTLSVRQPWATLICYGIKTVENRTWEADHRGRLLIHASGQGMSMFSEDHVSQNYLNELCDCFEIDNLKCPENASQSMKNTYRMYEAMYRFYGITIGDPRPMEEWMRQAVKERGVFFDTTRIIGEVELVDVAKNSKDDFAAPGQCHWILANPKIYEKPITNVLGKQRLWDFDLDSDIV